jgi:hypothetical protein
MNEAPTLLHDFKTYEHRSLTVKLVGKDPNRFALGARVIVRTGILHMMNEVRSGGAIFPRMICACDSGWGCEQGG